MASVAKTWDRIHAWLQSNAPEVLKNLRAGASEEEIKTLEDKLEINELPQDFKESYLIHNGCEGDTFFGRPGTWDSFHGTDMILQDWSVNQSVFNEGAWNNFIKSEAECLKIKQKCWDPRWITFGNNGCGDCICIDLAPEEAGTYGQVIHWYHEGPYTEWYAASFAEFLQQYADDLEAGNYKLSENECHLVWVE